MIKIPYLHQLKKQGDKITMMTSYDACFAQLQAKAGIEVLLVGDSLGMVLQGHKDTLPVTLEHMLYHTSAVQRGLNQLTSQPALTLPLVMADLPFLTDLDPISCSQHAGQLLQAGAQMVKIEGGKPKIPIIKQLRLAGIPVCGHLGLTPQSVHTLGGYKVQGKTASDADRILSDSLALEAAGIDMLVLECVPSDLGQRISTQLSIPVIGIGAGVHCDGQVLVLHDALGLTPGTSPKFSNNFMRFSSSAPEQVKTANPIFQALQSYVSDVKQARFPTAAHSF